MKFRVLLTALLIAGLVAACGDDTNDNNSGNNGNNGGGVDAGSDVSDDTTEDDDIESIGDVSDEEFSHRCQDAPVDDWPLNDAVSSGSVNASTADGVTTLEIDASAGGSMMSSDNPFLYVDLSSGEMLEITDLEAYANSEWNLAFKRFIIRTNSEDSGPGEVQVAKLSETSFDEVTEVPADPGAWETDESYTEDCEPLTDPIGTLTTAFNHLNPGSNSGSWYQYGPDGVSANQGDVYLVEVPSDGMTYKMVIDSWDDGLFTIRIAEL
jgi:hypothetical protein